MFKDSNDIAIAFTFLLLCLLAGAVVGVVSTTISVLAGLVYGALFWLVVCFGLPICICLFD